MCRASQCRIIIASLCATFCFSAPTLAQTTIRGEVLSSCGADRPQISINTYPIDQPKLAVHGATYTDVLEAELAILEAQADRIMLLGCIANARTNWTTHILEVWMPVDESFLENSKGQPMELRSVHVHFKGMRAAAIREAPVLFKVDDPDEGGLIEGQGLRMFSERDSAFDDFWQTKDVSGDPVWFKKVTGFEIEPVDAD